jgi:hypothetical protein
MQLYDQSGNLLFNLVAYAGQPPVTGCVNLLAGTYTIRFVAVAQAPSAVAAGSGAVATVSNAAAVSYALTGENLSYPLGALLTSTTSNATAPTYSTSSTTSGGTYSWPLYF